MTVLDIRGTHGSGKSFLVRTLLRLNKHKPIVENGQHQGYLLEERDVFVVGKYVTACGGCDGIKTADEVERRIRKYSLEHHVVVLEGILVSHTFKRYNQIAKDLEEQGVSYKFLFLDTPLDRCIARVKNRRLEKGNTKPFDPKNVIKDHANIWVSVRRKMIEAGRTVVELNCNNSYNEFRRELKSEIPS